MGRAGARPAAGRRRRPRPRPARQQPDGVPLRAGFRALFGRGDGRRVRARSRPLPAGPARTLPAAPAGARRRHPLRPGDPQADAAEGRGRSLQGLRARPHGRGGAAHLPGRGHHRHRHRRRVRGARRPRPAVLPDRLDRGGDRRPGPGLPVLRRPAVPGGDRPGGIRPPGGLEGRLPRPGAGLQPEQDLRVAARVDRPRGTGPSARAA